MDPLADAEEMACGFEEIDGSPFVNDNPDPKTCLRVTIPDTLPDQGGVSHDFLVSMPNIRSCDVYEFAWPCMIIPPGSEYRVWRSPTTPPSVDPEIMLAAVDCDATCPMP